MKYSAMYQSRPVMADQALRMEVSRLLNEHGMLCRQRGMKEGMLILLTAEAFIYTVVKFLF